MFPATTSSAAARPASSFSFGFAMNVELSLSHLDPNQISRQHNTEQSQQNRDHIDESARGLERVGVDLHPCLAVTIESGDNQEHAGDDRNHAQPSGESGGGCRFLFELQELLKRD